MKNLGEELRKKRIEKGLTVEDLSEKTFLSEAVINDIENGSFDRYSGDEAYVKMYLKKLSSALDLDTDEVTQTYIDLTEEIKRAELESVALDVTEKDTRRRKKMPELSKTYTGTHVTATNNRWTTIIRAIIVLLLVALIVTVIYVVISKTKPSQDTSYEPNTTDVSGQVDTNVEEKKEEETTPTEETTQPEEDNTTSTGDVEFTNKGYYEYEVTLPENTDKMTFKMEFEKAAWIRLLVNNKSVNGVASKVYNAGESVETEIDVKTFKNLKLRNGNGSGTKYYINGQEIPLTDEEKKGTTVNLSITLKE